MRIALAQIDHVVGDPDGNAEAVHAAYADAVADGARLVLTGELALTGYPPEDLVLKPAFVRANVDALHRLAARIGDVPLVVGFVEPLEDVDPASWSFVTVDGGARRPLANAAAVLRDGRVEAVYRKQRIPNYGVFDEARYFAAGRDPVVVDVDGVPVGVTVCEDLWGEGGPVPQAVDAGARLVVNVNGSPYSRGKRAERERWAAHHATRTGAWVAYLNQVGGQDEVVFDGDSFVLAPDGTVVARGAQFAEDTVLVDLPLGEEEDGDDGNGRARQVGGEAAPRLEPDAEVYAALVLGVRDYVRKNGFTSALVALSGGIDSALTAAVAADALGGDAVTCVGMPSPHSSPESVTDAKALAHNLGVHWLELPIGPVMDAFDRTLEDVFAGTEPGIAEENLQSRIRGNLMMAMSNKFGSILLATGNKSEYAVGYATLYGDTAGGFAVLKDVPKTLVWALSEERNRKAAQDGEHANGAAELIPRAIIDKEPSAELRPDQRDTDSLLPYDELDPILEGLIEDDRSVEELVADGHDEADVRAVLRLLDRAEYKRRQAAPGVKITDKAFGKDRRVPITQSWSG